MWNSCQEICVSGEMLCLYGTAKSSDGWEALRRSLCDAAFLLCLSLNSRIRESQFIRVQLPACVHLISADEKFWPTNFYTRTYRFGWDKLIWRGKDTARVRLFVFPPESPSELKSTSHYCSHFSSAAFLRLHPSVSCVIWNASFRLR